MRPVASPPLLIRGIEFGAAKPLFCVPLVAKDEESLLSQAAAAHALAPDVVEWRADFYERVSPNAFVEAARKLRSMLDSELILYTLRIQTEGGKQEIPQAVRMECVDAVVRSGAVDLVDLEVCNGPQFIAPILKISHDHGVRVLLSFHDFDATPSREFLLDKIQEMVSLGGDIAKIACMPRDRSDVLRLLEVTLQARGMFPAVPLCTMSMAAAGSLSRVAGFLYGSDMSFAVAQETSAPGQIPLADARHLADMLLRYA